MKVYKIEKPYILYFCIFFSPGRIAFSMKTCVIISACKYVFVIFTKYFINFRNRYVNSIDYVFRFNRYVGVCKNSNILVFRSKANCYVHVIFFPYWVCVMNLKNTRYEFIECITCSKYNIKHRCILCLIFLYLYQYRFNIKFIVFY